MDLRAVVFTLIGIALILALRINLLLLLGFGALSAFLGGAIRVYLYERARHELDIFNDDTGPDGR